MFRTRYFYSVLISACLIMSVTTPTSFADDPNLYTPAASDISSLLSADSTILIVDNSVTLVNNVYTFTDFDQALSTTYVNSPADYTLTSSGVLLQAKSGISPVNIDLICELEDCNLVETPNPAYTSSSVYAATLTTLITNNPETISSNTKVTDLSALEFRFSTDPYANSISVDFILASGEYFTGDWDLGGIYIDGENYAFLPNGHLLRINSSADVANVCTSGNPGGCYLSDYTLNGVTLSTISSKLTMYAPLNMDLVEHSFVAIIANTNDTVLPSSLLLSNFQSFGVAPENISTFSYGVQFEDNLQTDDLSNNVEPIYEMVPDPVQQSTITGSSVSTPDANNNVAITIDGTFLEELRNVDVNGRRISSDSWVQSSSTITLTVPSIASGIYAVQIYNGSAPVLQSQTVIATA